MRQEYIDNIKILLGGDILSLEIKDESISKMIDLSVNKISPYVNDTHFITAYASNFIELDDDVVDVIRVFESPDYSNHLNIDETSVNIINPYNMINYQIESVRRAELEYLIDKDFRYIDNKLYLDDYTGPITIEVEKKVTIDNLKDEVALNWVFDYALASCKEVVGRIRTKFKPNNIPIELDGETLLNEALESKERLESKIQELSYGIFYARR